jgi:hypothetical protein
MVSIRANLDGVQSVALDGPDATTLNDVTWPIIAKEVKRLDRVLRDRKRRFLRSL